MLVLIVSGDLGTVHMSPWDKTTEARASSLLDSVPWTHSRG